MLIEIDKRIQVINETNNIGDLFEVLQNRNTDLIVLNVKESQEQVNSICKNIHLKYPKIPILLFLDSCTIEVSIPEVVINGVRGIIWKENTKDELIEAIIRLSQGGLFFEDPENCRFNCHISQKLKKVQDVKNTDCLTIRELEVLKLIAEGLRYKDIADKLFISIRTVETHKNNIMKKLQFQNVNELIKYAIVNNIS
ncbi:MAG: response regulator transcription factor [Prolixibacteraceae bacterium]|nr:response regulator transcription factor [Prolixibacteraceae bacterium]MBN2774227.1 response regulator transcription factor [Prolixibacteraceae bacterium]